MVVLSTKYPNLVIRKACENNDLLYVKPTERDEKLFSYVKSSFTRDK